MNRSDESADEGVRSLIYIVLLELVVIVLGGFPAIVWLVYEVLHENFHLNISLYTFSRRVGIFLQKSLKLKPEKHRISLSLRERTFIFHTSSSLHWHTFVKCCTSKASNLRKWSDSNPPNILTISLVILKGADSKLSPPGPDSNMNARSMWKMAPSSRTMMLALFRSFRLSRYCMRQKPE